MFFAFFGKGNCRFIAGGGGLARIVQTKQIFWPIREPLRPTSLDWIPISAIRCLGPFGAPFFGGTFFAKVSDLGPLEAYLGPLALLEAYWRFAGVHLVSYWRAIGSTRGLMEAYAGLWRPVWAHWRPVGSNGGLVGSIGGKLGGLLGPTGCLLGCP